MIRFATINVATPGGKSLTRYGLCFVVRVMVIFSSIDLF